MGFLTRQLRSVVQWSDPDPGVLFECWSKNGDEIKDASQLIVGPGQGCVFVYEGQVEAMYTEPGVYDIKTENIPFLTTLVKLMQAFKSEHKVGLYYFRTAKLLNLKWGTESLIKYEDPEYKFPVGLRAFGNYSVRIADGRGFFQQVVGGASVFRVDDIRKVINGRLLQPLADYLAEAGLSYVQVDPKREEIAAGLSKKLVPELAQLGFVLDDFRIEGSSFDEDTMRRINRVADINAEAHAAKAAGVSYAQLQQLTALRDAAKNASGVGTGMGMALGMGMAGAVGTVPVAATVGAPATEDAAAKLRNLKVLFDQQLITQENYEAKKREILAEL